MNISFNLVKGVLDEVEETKTNAGVIIIVITVLLAGGGYALKTRRFRQASAR